MSPHPRPVVFGEVLFDRFEDGKEVLGGAPFNVAWHLHGFGEEPLFVSRVGEDDRGRRVLEAMAARGMDARGVQRDPERPTGVVEAHVEDGSPSYTIRPDQAYDRIVAGAARAAAVGRTASALYHGTLALRETRNREAFHALRDGLGAPVFLDVNLREPWWTREQVLEEIPPASWVKLNHDELEALASGSSDRDLPRSAAAFAAHHGLQGLLVTRGEDGALAVDARGGTVSVEAASPEHMVDSVGAGDAFAAVTLTGLRRGWGWETILRRASRFAARICGIRGAIPDAEDLYAEETEAWRENAGG